MGKLSEIGTAYAAERVALAAYNRGVVAELGGKLGKGGVIELRQAYEAAQAATLAANQDYIDDPEAEGP